MNNRPTAPTLLLFTFLFLTPLLGQSTSEPRLVVQTGHQYSVSSADLSLDERLLVTTDRFSAKIWDLQHSAEIRSVSDPVGGNSGMYSAAFSPDGHLIAFGQVGGIKLRKLKDNSLQKTLVGEANELVYFVKFQPNGKTLISMSILGGNEGRTKIWDIESGTSTTLTKEKIVTMAASHNGKYIAFSSSNNTLQVWDITAGIVMSKVGDIKTMAIDFSFDDKFIAVGGYKELLIFDVFTGKKHFGFLTDHVGWIGSVNFSSDGTTLATCGQADEIVKTWNYKKGIKLTSYDFGSNDVSKVLFLADGRKLLGFGREFRIWETSSGKVIEKIRSHSPFVYNIKYSPNSDIFASVDLDGYAHIWHLTDPGRFKHIFAHPPYKPIDVAFSPDVELLVTGGGDRLVKLWDTDNGSLVESFAGHTDGVLSVAFSAGKKYVVSGSEDQTLRIWDMDKKISVNKINEVARVSKVAFSPDGNLIASNAGDSLVFRNLRGEMVSKRASTNDFAFSGFDNKIAVVGLPEPFVSPARLDTVFVESLQSGKGKVMKGGLPPIDLSNDAKRLISTASYVGGRNDILLWDVEGEKLIYRQFAHDHWISGLQISPNGKYILSGSFDGKLKLWHLDSGKELASLTVVNKTDWIITTPDGRFETNKLEDPKGLHWIMPDAPSTALSFEVFMRDYYEPNLLPRLLKCNEENNCDQEFKPVRNLTELNRTQPKVRIAGVKPTKSADVVQVTVEAEDVASEFQKDKQNQPLHSGVYDLRLFRDGQLVGYSTADEKLQATFRSYKDSGEELKVWQTANKVELDKGRKTFTFDVRLPGNADSNDFSFTAYAFNSDRVKSETASQSYTRLQNNSSTVKGNAYRITIGVNANDDRRFDLRYAANDARKLQEQLVKNLPKDRYSKVVQIPLISDYDKDGKLGENNATKAKIRAVFDKLSGKLVPAEALKDIPNKDSLVKVRPEDLVLIAFSGHGYADRNGVFYLIPSDIGTNASGGLTNVLPKSISSDELSLWLRGIDAGEMMMIVDACHSAAAVQGAGFKPGPMGSRGLGQLSYDKGMRILTATQADNVALELNNLQQGLLTYSLVKNGIELGNADYQPKDTKLFSNEWLSFSVKDVPQLYEKLSKGEIKGLLIDGAKPKSDVLTIGDDQKTNLNLQQPSLFDFSRKGRQFELLSLAK